MEAALTRRRSPMPLSLWDWGHRSSSEVPSLPMCGTFALPRPPPLPPPASDRSSAEASPAAENAAFRSAAVRFRLPNLCTAPRSGRGPLPARCGRWLLDLRPVTPRGQKL